MVTRTSVSLTEPTREALKFQKRHGESYDQLLQRMLEHYDPENRS